MHPETNSFPDSRFPLPWPRNAYLQTPLLITSRCISKPAQSRSGSVSRTSLDHGPQVYLQILSITASFDYHLPVGTIMASKCKCSLAPLLPLSLHSLALQVHVAKLTQLQPPSLQSHSLKVHRQTQAITSSKCICKFNRLRPPSFHHR